MLFLMGLYQTSSENDLCTVTTCQSWGIWCIRQRKRCLKVWLSVYERMITILSAPVDQQFILYHICKNVSITIFGTLKNK